MLHISEWDPPAKGFLKFTAEDKTAKQGKHAMYYEWIWLST